METEVLTVSQLGALVNQTLQFAYPEVIVEGEVNSFKISQSKWVFFDLKDAESTIGCFMSIHQLKTQVEDGMLVRVHCAPKLTQWGKFSLTIRSLELAGEGAVKKAFEIMKAQFEKEGLFAADRKRSLPEIPTKIGLITSAQAAAFNDFITIINDRWAGLEINHAQVQVQGADATDQIVRAIEYFNCRPDYDALVIIRGGGSPEDLQTFNTEPVVRAIYGSKTPTMVGIGHEDDISLAELAADVRVATPTDAARRLVPDKTAFVDQLSNKISASSTGILNQIEHSHRDLEQFGLAFRDCYLEFIQKADTLIVRMSDRAKNMLEVFLDRILIAERVLRSLDPKAVLARGYSIATVDSQVVSSSKQISATDTVVLQLHQGSVNLQKLTGSKVGKSSQHEPPQKNYQQIGLQL